VFALVIAGVSVMLAHQRWKTGLLAFVKSLPWQGQWALNSWLNIAITAALLLATFYPGGSGFSPLEMISEKADATFVAVLRQRFPRHEQV
jgi:hypothetical protein